MRALHAKLKESEAEVKKLKEELSRQRGSWKAIRISTPLSHIEHTEWTPVYSNDSRIDWQTWCPCCRRPLDLSLFGPRPSWNWSSGISEAISASKSPRYAYAAALWGSGPGFVLGALVLAQALKRTGTKHELVLMHCDVKKDSLDLLFKAGWVLKEVQYIDADAVLFNCSKSGRFAGVFTKLHALNLVEYDKVLMLDIDLVIIHCPDELFELEAPAALRRGIHHHEHGALIDGRRWFTGEEFDWVQSGGINAGVMLLEPNAEVHMRALREVKIPWHPSHIPGNGPEQDYLSRLYAHAWHHLSVKWNWQLHQMFHALEAALENETGVKNRPALGAGLPHPQTAGNIPEELQGIEDGTEVQSIALPPRLEELPVFATADSFEIVGNIFKNNKVVARGPPVCTAGCPMIPLRDPYGFVDGRQVRPTGQKVQTSPRGPGRPAGFSLTPHRNHEAEQLAESLVSEGDCDTHDMWKDWLPERIATDLEDVHILHFSGEVKIWDRFLEGSTESDEAFASRLLDGNTEFYSRLFIKQAGTEDEYRSHGLELVDGKFRCPLKKDPEAVGKTIERSVKQVRDAAFKATELWREDYESLPGVLQCTQEELLAKMQGVSCISSGMKFTCATDYGMTIWASAHEWTEVGKLSFGDEVIAAGPLECFDCVYWMMPISTPMQGSVEFRYLEAYAEPIERVDSVSDHDSVTFYC
mgnify:FL=1